MKRCLLLFIGFSLSAMEKSSTRMIILKFAQFKKVCQSLDLLMTIEGNIEDYSAKWETYNSFAEPYDMKKQLAKDLKNTLIALNEKLSTREYKSAYDELLHQFGPHMVADGSDLSCDWAWIKVKNQQALAAKESGNFVFFRD